MSQQVAEVSLSQIYGVGHSELLALYLKLRPGRTVGDHVSDSDLRHVVVELAAANGLSGKFVDGLRRIALDALTLKEDITTKSLTTEYLGHRRESFRQEAGRRWLALSPDWEQFEQPRRYLALMFAVELYSGRRSKLNPEPLASRQIVSQVERGERERLTPIQVLQQLLETVSAKSGEG